MRQVRTKGGEEEGNGTEEGREEGQEDEKERRSTVAGETLMTITRRTRRTIDVGCDVVRRRCVGGQITDTYDDVPKHTLTPDDLAD